MHIHGQYMSCTFDGLNNNIVVYENFQLKVYDNNCEPMIIADEKDVNGAIFDGNKLFFTCESHSKIGIISGKNKDSIALPYSEAKIICAVRNQINTLVLQIKEKDMQEYIVYNPYNQQELFKLPIQNFRDLAWIGNDEYFCLCEDTKNISLYKGDCDFAYCYGIKFKVNYDLNTIEEIGRMEVLSLEIDSSRDNFKIVGSYSEKMKLPLFDYYLYEWPQQLSVSSTGQFVVYYIKNILDSVQDSIIIAERTSGDIFRVFPLPIEMYTNNEIEEKSEQFTCSFNDQSNQLVMVNLETNNTVCYNISCISEEDIDNLNLKYNKYFNAKKYCAQNFSFKLLIHDALMSCACINSENNSIENRPQPYNGQEPYIFVSYAHKDYKKVWRLIGQLQKYGYRIWYDEGITPGTEWDAFIEHQLEKASCCIFCITDNYWKSRNCLDELKYSADLGDKEMLLIYLSDTSIPDGTGLRMRIGRIQNIHFSNFDLEESFLNTIMLDKGLDIAKI